MKVGLEFIVVGVVSALVGIGVTLMTRSLGTRDLHTRMDRLDGRMDKLTRVLIEEPHPIEEEWEESGNTS